MRQQTHRHLSTALPCQHGYTDAKGDAVEFSNLININHKKTEIRSKLAPAIALNILINPLFNNVIEIFDD